MINNEFSLTVASTSLMVGTPPAAHPSIKLKGTTGSKKLVSLVKKATGKKVDLFPVHRTLLSSTDDTILFVCPTTIVSKRKMIR